MANQRRIRKDIQVGNLEKKKGFEPGTIRNVDGTDSRSDKELGTLRDEYGEQAMENMLVVMPERDQNANEISWAVIRSAVRVFAT